METQLTLITEEWINRGRVIAAHYTCNNWMLGDWINSLDHSEKWKAIAEIFDGADIQNLRHISEVAALFPLETRFKNLSFKFYSIAVNIPDNKKALELLAAADRERPTVKEFRDTVRSLNQPYLKGANGVSLKPDRRVIETPVANIVRRFKQENQTTPFREWTHEKRKEWISQLEPAVEIFEELQNLEKV